MSPALRFERVCKHYRLYAHPRDRLLELLARRPRHRLHVALEQIDFCVARGETFGLVGENGAGKSTLLKLAAGTIGPTSGRIERHGSVAALLELGAGFHPEESGHDNVRFMAALNGIPREAFEDYHRRVIEFSELDETTLARPVKTYSSGMFMRLAFSAATALEPEILIIDEALSVGDMHFQKKSLDRILALRDAGATVLFCSHNLYQVRSLCRRAAWIHRGRIAEIGDTEPVVTAYEAHERRKSAPTAVPAASPTNPSSAPPAAAGEVKFRALQLETADGFDPAFVESFQDLTVELTVEALGERPFHVGLALVRNDRDNVFGTSTHFRDPSTPLSGRGEHRLRLRFPQLPLLSGEYLWSVYVLDDTGLQVLDMAECIHPFKILNRGCRDFGLVRLPYEWELVA